MIQSIEINNFQSHKKTELVFSPGVNCILGTSDSGKTAILRALNWVTNNRPGGDAYRSYWDGDTEVAVKVAGITVTRAKHKNGIGDNNFYSISTLDSHLTGFGQSAPDAVNEILNMGTINIQAQLDAPFMLSSNAGEVARQLNQIANLQIIDTAQTNIKSAVKKTKSRKSYVEDDIEAKQKKLDEMKWLDNFEIDIQAAEIIQNEIDKIEGKQNSLAPIISQCKETQNSLDSYRQIETVSNEIKKVEALYTELEKGLKSQNLGQSLVDSIKAAKNKKKQVKKLVSLDIPLTEYLELKKQMEEQEDQEYKLSGLIKSAYTIHKTIKTKVAEIETAEKEFHELMPEQCPLCGK